MYDIQFQTFYNTYVLNAKKGKVHSIKRKFYDLSQMRKKISFNYDLFVINTSGDKKYDNNDFQNLKNFLDNKFYISTPYEIVNYKNGTINNTGILTVDNGKIQNLKEYEKKPPNSESKNCRKFMENPQQFFTEDLCDVMLLQYDIDPKEHLNSSSTMSLHKKYKDKK